jgi:hypothetical protein
MGFRQAQGQVSAIPRRGDKRRASESPRHDRTPLRRKASSSAMRRVFFGTAQPYPREPRRPASPLDRRPERNTMPILQAQIQTERASRYLVQFCKHAAAMGSGGHSPRMHLHGVMTRREVQVVAEARLAEEEAALATAKATKTAPAGQQLVAGPRRGPAPAVARRDHQPTRSQAPAARPDRRRHLCCTKRSAHHAGRASLAHRGH